MNLAFSETKDFILRTVLEYINLRDFNKSVNCRRLIKHIFMKKVFVLAVSAMLSIVATAEEFKGKAANDTISGTNWLRFKTHTSFPNFVRFQKNHQFPQAHATQWMGKFFEQNGFGVALSKSSEDDLGFVHYRYHQTFKNIPIELTQYIVHTQNNQVVMMNGEFTDQAPNTTAASINEPTALQTALQFVGAETYKWELPNHEEEHDPAHHHHAHGSPADYNPTGELVIAPVDGKLENDFRLAYKFNIYAHQPMSRQHIYVDAVTNQVIYTQNLIHTADAVGTAETGYSGQRTMTADSFSGGFRLRESGRGNGINTFNMQEGTNYGAAVDFTDSDNFWDNANAQLDEFATDAHWGAEMTYDYFMLEHNRNSIDGNGFALNSYVHYDVSFANAFWDGQRMTYGDGNGTSITPLTALDIISHEIAHGLTTNSANLVYQDEPGALNESFSDIFGATVEQYGRPNNWNWLIGEDIGITIRSMVNPNQFGDPDTYDGTNWYTGTQDNGGVHINSGVQNKWFYILTEGEQGINDLGDSYNVSGIGMSDASKVAFRNLTVYLTQTSEFDDARFYAILSAIDLFGSCSPEVAAVTDAWHAVGVGNPYVPFVVSDFDAPITSSCDTPFMVDFTNQSINGTSFNWNFGDGNTSTDLNPSNVYTTPGTYDVELIVDGGACGSDTTTLTNFIAVGPNEPCIATMPSTGIGAIQTGCTGSLFDPGGPSGNYNNSNNSVMTLAPTGASAITLDVISFDVEAEATCGYDYLEIYEGSNTSGNLLGTYCNGTPPPATMNINGGAVTFLFSSDFAVTQEGFQINWQCEIPQIPPVSDFTTSTQESCVGEVFFYDATLYQPVTWLWDFGDGNTSTQQNPSHTYQQSGLYNVTLTTTNQYGTDSEVKNSHILITKPSAPAINDETVCVANDLDLISPNQNGGVTNWYTVPTGGSPFFTGDTLSLTNLQADTSFFAEELIQQPAQSVGPPDNTFGGGSIFNNGAQYLIFDAYQDFTLKSVRVYAGGAADRLVELRDSQGNVIQDTLVNIPGGNQRIDLNFDVPAGTDYQLGVDPSSSPSLYRNNNGPSYPYTLSGLCQIKQSSAQGDPFGYYYFFYDWEVQELPCISERTEVNIKVEICSSVNELSDASLQVYPNPTQGWIQLNRDERSNTEVVISAVNGQELRSFNWNSTNTSIDISNFASGIYFIKIDSDIVRIVKH